MGEVTGYRVDFSRVPKGFFAAVGWDGEFWAALVAPQGWWGWRHWEEVRSWAVLGDTPEEAFLKALAEPLTFEEDEKP